MSQNLHLHSLPGPLKAKHIKQNRPSLDLVKRHLRTLTLHCSFYYPAHERRASASTTEFRRSRHQLIEVEQRGCWTCGTREKLESHHYYIEWSLQNAVDWQAFIRDFPQWAKYPNVGAFVDSVDNQRILCARHHRRKGVGIHTSDYPEWQIQRWIMPGFVYTQEASQ